MSSAPKTSPENKKYELLADDTVTDYAGRTLFRIRALSAIGSRVAAGELGGYIANEACLQFCGNAWVSGNARASGNALVSGNAHVYGNAQVHGDARVERNAKFGWASNVGSEGGTLTWAPSLSGGIWVSRGCFSGSLDEFAAAVERTHGDSKLGREYRLLIEFIRLRCATEADQ